MPTLEELSKLNKSNNQSVQYPTDRGSIVVPEFETQMQSTLSKEELNNLNFDYKKYDFENANINDLKHTNQSTAGMVANSLFQGGETFIEALLGGVAMVGSLGYAAGHKALSGGESSFTDDLLRNDVMKGLYDADSYFKEKIAPIYLSQDQLDNPNNLVNFATQIPNGIGFLASAFVPTMMISKAISGLGKFGKAAAVTANTAEELAAADEVVVGMSKIGKKLYPNLVNDYQAAAKSVSKLTKEQLKNLPKELESLVKNKEITAAQADAFATYHNSLNGLGEVVGTIYSRLNESQMESYQFYKQIVDSYKDKIDNGEISQEEVEKVAKEQANNVFGYNMALAAIDLFQYKTWFGGRGGLPPIGKIENGLAQGIKLGRLGKFAKSAGRIAGTAFSEGEEEGIQYGMQNAAVKLANNELIGHKDDSWLKKQGDFISTSLEENIKGFSTQEGRLSMELGALLGGGMSVVTNRGKNKKYEDDANQAAKTYNNYKGHDDSHIPQEIKDAYTIEEGKVKFKKEFIAQANNYQKLAALRDAAYETNDFVGFHQFDKLLNAYTVSNKILSGDFDNYIGTLKDLQGQSKQDIIESLKLKPETWLKDENGEDVEPNTLIQNKIKEAKEFKDIFNNIHKSDFYGNLSFDAKQNIVFNLFASKINTDVLDNVNNQISKINVDSLKYRANNNIEGTDFTEDTVAPEFRDRYATLIKEKESIEGQNKSLLQDYKQWENNPEGKDFDLLDKQFKAKGKASEEAFKEAEVAQEEEVKNQTQDTIDAINHEDATIDDLWNNVLSKSDFLQKELSLSLKDITDGFDSENNTPIFKKNALDIIRKATNEYLTKKQEEGKPTIVYSVKDSTFNKLYTILKHSLDTGEKYKNGNSIISKSFYVTVNDEVINKPFKTQGEAERYIKELRKQDKTTPNVEVNNGEGVVKDEKEFEEGNKQLLTNISATTTSREFEDKDDTIYGGVWNRIVAKFLSIFNIKNGEISKDYKFRVVTLKDNPEFFTNDSHNKELGTTFNETNFLNKFGENAPKFKLILVGNNKDNNNQPIDYNGKVITEKFHLTVSTYLNTDDAERVRIRFKSDLPYTEWDADRVKHGNKLKEVWEYISNINNPPLYIKIVGKSKGVPILDNKLVESKKTQSLTALGKEFQIADNIKLQISKTGTTSGRVFINYNEGLLPVVVSNVTVEQAKIVYELLKRLQQSPTKDPTILINGVEVGIIHLIDRYIFRGRKDGKGIDFEGGNLLMDDIVISSNQLLENKQVIIDWIVANKLFNVKNDLLNTQDWIGLTLKTDDKGKVTIGYEKAKSYNDFLINGHEPILQTYVAYADTSLDPTGNIDGSNISYFKSVYFNIDDIGNAVAEADKIETPKEIILQSVPIEVYDDKGNLIHTTDITKQPKTNNTFGTVADNIDLNDLNTTLDSKKPTVNPILNKLIERKIQEIEDRRNNALIEDYTDRGDSPPNEAKIKAINDKYDKEIAVLKPNHSINPNNNISEDLKDEEGDEGIWRIIKKLGYTDIEDVDKAREWFYKKFPKTIEFKDVANAIKGKAMGRLRDSIVEIWRGAEEGTTYHEAFHVVFNLFMSPQEREKYYKEFRDKNEYKDTFRGENKNTQQFTDLEIEEHLAEDFRDYILTNGEKASEKWGFFKTLYEKIKAWLEHLIFNKSHANILFDKIDRGYFKEKTPQQWIGERNKVGHWNEQMSNVILQGMTADFMSDLIGKGITIDELIAKGDKVTANIYDNLKEKYAEDVNTILEDGKKIGEDWSIKNAVIIKQDMLANWDDYVKHHAKELKKHGLKVTIKELTEDEQEELETFGNKLDYGKTTIEADPSLSISGRVNLLLSTIREWSVNSKGKQGIYANKYGFYDLANISTLYKQILNYSIENNIETVEEFEKGLHKLKETVPEINTLLIRLGNEYTDANMNLWLDFRQAFDRTKNSMIVNINGTIIDLQQQAIENQVTQEWMRNFRVNDNYNKTETVPFYTGKKTVGIAITYLDLSKIIEDGDNITTFPKALEFLKKLGIEFSKPELITETTEVTNHAKFINEQLKKFYAVYSKYKEADYHKRLYIDINSLLSGLKKDVFKRDLAINKEGTNIPDVIKIKNQLDALIAIESKYSDTIDFSYPDINQKTKYGVTLKTLINYIINKINKGELPEHLLYSIYSKNSKIIQDKVKIEVMYDGGNRYGFDKTANEELNEYQRLRQSIEGITNAVYPNYKESDSTLNYAFKLKEFVKLRDVNNFYELYKDYFKQYLTDEVLDIIVNHPQIKVLGQFSGLLSDELTSALLNQTEDSLNQFIEDNDAQIQKELEENINRLSKELYDKLENIGYIKQNKQDKNKFDSTIAGTFLNSKEGRTPLGMSNGNTNESVVPKTNFALFTKYITLNHIVSKIEISKLFLGNLVAYKNDNEVLKRNKFNSAATVRGENSDDLMDKMDKQYPRSDSNPHSKDMEVLSLPDNETQLVKETLDNIRKQLEDKVSEELNLPKEDIKVINSVNNLMKIYTEGFANTDGNMLLFNDAYKQFMISIGRWDKYKEVAFNKWVNGEESTFIAHVEKLQYGFIDAEGNPISLKIAALPLRKSDIVVGSRIDEELKKVNGYVDAVVYTSGTKITKWNGVKSLSFEGLGLQVENTQKKKNIINVITQLEKHIISLTYSNGQPIGATKEEIEKNRKRISDINKYKDAILKLQEKKIFNILGLDENGKLVDKEKLIEFIEEKAFDSEFNNNDLSAIGLMFDEKTDILLPLSYLLANERVQPIINAAFNQAIKDKKHGSQLVQVPSIDFDYKVGEEGLRFYFDKDKLVGLDVKLPSYFNGTIPIGDIKDEKLLKLIAARIPVQGLNSIEFLNVVGFLDKSFGNTIFTGKGLFQKAGSDSDFDKLSIYYPYFDKDNNYLEYWDNPTDEQLDILFNNFKKGYKLTKEQELLKEELIKKSNIYQDKKIAQIDKDIKELKYLNYNQNAINEIYDNIEYLELEIKEQQDYYIKNKLDIQETEEGEGEQVEENIDSLIEQKKIQLKQLKEFYEIIKSNPSYSSKLEETEKHEKEFDKQVINYKNKIDKLGREQFNNLSIEEKNGYERLNNKVLENYTDILKEENTLKQMLFPNNTEVIKKINNQFLPKVKNLKQSLNLVWLEKQAAINNETKRLVAIQAASGAAHIKFQLAGIYTDNADDIKFSRKNEENGLLLLGKTHAANGKFIIDSFNELLNVVVDAVKNTLNINLSEFTIPVVNLLVHSGVSLREALILNNQPIIRILKLQVDRYDAGLINEDSKTIRRDLCKRLLSELRSLNIGFNDELYKDTYNMSYLGTTRFTTDTEAGILEKRAVGLKDVESISQLKKAFDNYIGREATNQEYGDFLHTQLDFLVQFNYYKNLSSDLYKIESAIKQDTQGKTKNPHVNIRREEQIIDLIENSKFKNLDKVFSNTFLGEQRRYIKRATEADKNWFLSLHEKIYPVIKKILDIYKGSKDADYLNIAGKLENEITLFTLLTVPTAHNKVLYNKYKSLFVDNTFAEQILYIKKNKTLPPNSPFYKLKDIIIPIINANRKMPDNVLVNRNYSSDQEKVIIADFMLELNSDNREIIVNANGEKTTGKELVQNMFYVALIQSGLTYSPNTFTRSLPSEMYMQFAKEVYAKVLENIDNINFDSFYHQFFRNNKGDKLITPQLYNAKDYNDKISFRSFLAIDDDTIKTKLNMPYITAKINKNDNYPIFFAQTGVITDDKGNIKGYKYTKTQTLGEDDRQTYQVITAKEYYPDNRPTIYAKKGADLIESVETDLSLKNGDEANVELTDEQIMNSKEYKDLIKKGFDKEAALHKIKNNCK